MEQEARKRQRGLVVAQGWREGAEARGGTEEGRQEEARKEIRKMGESSPDLSLRLRRGSSDSRDSFYMDFAQVHRYVSSLDRYPRGCICIYIYRQEKEKFVSITAPAPLSPPDSR